MRLYGCELGVGFFKPPPIPPPIPPRLPPPIFIGEADARGSSFYYGGGVGGGALFLSSEDGSTASDFLVSLKSFPSSYISDIGLPVF